MGTQTQGGLGTVSVLVSLPRRGARVPGVLSTEGITGLAMGSGRKGQWVGIQEPRPPGWSIWEMEVWAPKPRPLARGRRGQKTVGACPGQPCGPGRRSEEPDSSVVSLRAGRA